MREESKTVRSAAVKPKEIGQEKGHGNAEGSGEEEVQESGSDAELHQFGQHEDGEPTQRSGRD